MEIDYSWDGPKFFFINYIKPSNECSPLHLGSPAWSSAEL